MIKPKYIIGVDEVGRGPIAGPLAVCAFMVARKYQPYILRGIKESKQLSFVEREEWFRKITSEKKKGRARFTLSYISHKSIDRFGISLALRRAIKRSLLKLEVGPEECLVLLDGGIKAPVEYIHQKTIIKGDAKVRIIAMASVVAKVLRDRVMIRYAKKFQWHGFEKHKGYGTREHFELIKVFGLTDIHRQSFLKKFLVNR